MKRGEYIFTDKGQRSLLWKRRLRQYVYSPIHQEPKSKNSISDGEALAFQQSLLVDMENHGRSSFRSLVALQLDFSPTLRNSPAIHTMAKNYIDLLMAPVATLATNRKHLVLLDDRQIQYLSVKYHVSIPNPHPAIRLQVVSYRDLLDDLALLERIENNDFVEDTDSFDWDRHRGGSRRVHDRVRFRDDAIEKLEDLESDKDSWIKTVGIAGYRAWHEMLIIDVQREALRSLSPTARTLQWLLAPRISKHAATSGIAEILSGTRDLMISPPLAIDLQHSDLKQGGSAKYKRLVEAALASYRARYPLLFPMRIPLGITIIFQPPKERGIDLDNLARRIVPFVNLTFQPPTSRLRSYDASTVPDPRLRASFQKRQQELANMPLNSVTFYEVVQLPRFPKDDPRGFVRLLLSDGTVPSSLWDKVADAISDWEDEE